ncbi:MAG: ATP-binding protein, partial [Moorea sp. SIO2B7]|nr:ATP-binding protein [Moorena sp. SIO2B7]
MSQDLITKVYNAFNPFEPLQPGDRAYVNCSKVRGNENIFREIGRKIERSDISTCQLYTGHRGVGKSTELLRLKADLETKGFFVIYFAATEGDIDEQDTEYADILLACTRHILEELKNYAKPQPLLNWLQSRWTALQDLALSEVKFDRLGVEEQIAVFTKLTATLRRIPKSRDTIRKQINLYSISLIEALNEFIGEASIKLSASQKKLVVIADNLDRIVPVARGDKRNSHDEIFIDYNSQLKSLDCHVVYTVPISLVYSNRAT